MHAETTAQIAARLERFNERVQAACSAVGRSPEKVTVVAVSKFQPLELILALHSLGQHHFGESRAQELLAKVQQYAQRGKVEANSGNPPARLPESTAMHWHFIGNLQANKVRKVLQCCPTIHSISSLRLIERIERISAELQLRPEGFVQVNLDLESSKSGFAPDELAPALEQLPTLKHLQIKGLMTIGAPRSDPDAQRRAFARLRTLRDELERRVGCKLPALSMGMSADFEAAIAEGATHIRPGTALMGKREEK